MLILLARALIRIVSWFPLKALYYAAIPLGRLAALVPSRKQAVIDAHLALAFPELDERGRRRLQRAHAIEMMRLVLESGAVWHWSEQEIVQHVPEVNGWEHVEQAQAAGAGFLIVGAHLGNWEILNLYGNIRQPVVCLYKAPRNARIKTLITRSRERFGGKLIASGSPGMRRMLGQLKRGGGVGLLADQQPKQGEGVFVPLFGKDALTMTLVNRLARRTGCRVLLVSSHRLSGGRGWAVDVRPADARIHNSDPVVAMASFHEWLEARIREHPAQYLWRYKRYSIRPAGQPDCYKMLG